MKYRTDPAELVPMAWHAPWEPTEAQFAELFTDIARAKGWRAYHTYDSRRSTAGFPDYVLVHPSQRRVVFAELKGWKGEATEDQRAWLRDLDAAGAESYLITTTGDYAADAASLAELLTTRPTRGGA